MDHSSSEDSLNVTFALSTNWNNSRLNDGAAIADEAEELGFDALELGFRTQPEQLPGFRSRLDRMPVTSVHAYCPVPIGAPSGHPELYQLCSPDANERALARMLLEKTFSMPVMPTLRRFSAIFLRRRVSFA